MTITAAGRAFFGSMALVLATSLGCAVGGPSAQRQGESVGSTAPQRVLQIGMLGESQPPTITTYGRGTGLNGREHFYVFHASLVVYDQDGRLQPSIAAKVPRIEDGDWTVLPSGQMEVSFKIRPGVVWHDGTPLTAEDFVFGFQVSSDPDYPGSTLALRPLAAVRAPDPQTIVIEWKSMSPFGAANANEGVPALPRHLFQDLYLQGDRAAFDASSRWREDWVGLGPYRLTRWEQGSFMEAAAFDQYFMGKPGIERIKISYIGDANTLTASILADAVDVVPSGAGLDLPEAAVIRDRWATSGVNGSILLSVKGQRALLLQFRYQAPWAGDVRIRRALAHALNRDELAETQTEGLMARADFPVPSDSELYALARQRGLPTYGFDVARAHQLMADAGWPRGADGVFRDSSGEAFPVVDPTGNQGVDNVREATAVSAMWSAAGFRSEAKSFTALRGPALAEEEQTFPGAQLKLWSYRGTYLTQLNTVNIGTPATRWTGQNFGGWVNPQYESVGAQYESALDPAQRREHGVNLLRVLAEELPVIGLWDAGNVSIARPGISGPTLVPAESATTTWNIHTWQSK